MLRKNVQKQVVADKIVSFITIAVPQDIVEKFIIFLLQKKRDVISMSGLHAGVVPINYIKKNYEHSLVTHLKNIFYHFYVLPLLVQELRLQGAYIPKIFDFHFICNMETKEIVFSYAYIKNLLEYVYFPEYKRIKFPERKKYRDLDKQAKWIIDSEQKNKELYSYGVSIDEDDWVCIRIFFIDDHKNIIDERVYGLFWLYITNEIIDRELCSLFFGKKKGDVFFTNGESLAKSLGLFFIDHEFMVVIVDHVSNKYFITENFRHVFGYDNKVTFEKIVEIFSLKNDIPLKKEKSQIALQFFLEKIKIYVEKDIMDEHELILKNKLLKNADYLLYQGELNFDTNIKKLSCRQSMEKILVDYLIFFYKLESSSQLLYWYMNILQRPRLKEFLYFDANYLYDTHHKSQLIQNVFIEQIALRERVIEYMIQKLS